MIKELNGIDEQAFKIGELVEHDGPERKTETELYRTNYGYEKKITVTSYEIAEDVLSANYRYGEENNQTKFYALNKDDALNIAVEQDFKFNVPFSEAFNRSEFIDAQYEHHMGKIPSFNINGEIVSAKTLPFDELDTLNGLNKVEIYLLPLVELEQLVKENHIQNKGNYLISNNEKLPVLTLGTKGNITIPDARDIDKYLSGHTLLVSLSAISKTDLSDKLDQEHIYIKDGLYTVKTERDYCGDIVTYLDNNLSMTKNEVMSKFKNQMQELNYYINDKKVGLSEIEKILDINHQKKFNQINNLNKTGMENQKVSGFIGKELYYNDKSSVVSFQLGETKDNKTTWTNVKAFGETAKEIASAIGLTKDLVKAAEEKNEKKFDTKLLSGIKKFTVEGPIKDDKPYINKDGKEITPSALNIKSLQYHQMHEFNGVIAKAEPKTTKTGKEYVSLYVKNNVDRGGAQQTIDYNIKIYPSVTIPQRKNPDGTDWGLERGQPIAVKGELTTNFYIKDGELKKGENTTAWNVDRTLTLLQSQIKEKQETQDLSL